MMYDVKGDNQMIAELKPNGPVSALSAAKLMCERSNWSLTNLQLHKLLYIAHMIYMGDYQDEKRKLLIGQFGAWKHGPVHPQVYGKLNVFGKDKIPKHGFGNVDDLSRDEYPVEINHLNEVFDEVGNLPTGKLVSFTHRRESAWYDVYKDGDGLWNAISDEDIINEYNNTE